MNINDIKKAIEKDPKLRSQLIQELKDNVKWLKVPELKKEIEMEVTYKNKSYNDIMKLGIKEEDFLTIQECIFLANHNKYSKILKMDGSSNTDDFFIQQPFDINRKNNHVARFDADSVGANLFCNRNPEDSNPDLGVRRWRGLKDD